VKASKAQLPPPDGALNDAPGQTVGFVVFLIMDVSRVIHRCEEVRAKRIYTVSEEPPLSPGGCSQPADGGLAEDEGVVCASRPSRHDIKDDALMVAHHLAVHSGISLPAYKNMGIHMGRKNWN
jgi:hypothetical protein